MKRAFTINPTAAMAAILVLGLLPIIGSCMHTVRASREEITSGQYTVSALVLRSDEEIRFDSRGARYDSKAGLFEGRTLDGEDRAVGLGDVKRVRYYRFVKGDPKEIESDRFAFTATARREYNESIVRVIRTDGEYVEFDFLGGRLSSAPWQIRGFSKSGEPVSVPLTDVLYVEIRKTDPVMTTVATLGFLALAGAISVGIIMATKESCPFVYSYDGESYILDAEPLGGAITKGLERTDLSRLERIRPVDGFYRLLFRNEVEETQQIDHCEILLVDHPPGTEVVHAPSGGFFAVQDPIPPARVVDESGREITSFFQSRDGIAWQSQMPIDPSAPLPMSRQTLTVTIPRPQRAGDAHLQINAGATFWGSNMIREMLELRGPHVDSWYAAIDAGGPARAELDAWLEREELYDLKVQVLEPDGFHAQGAVHSNGPLVIEDRILPLDLSRVEGDSITLRFDPPFGFWSIDYIALVMDPLACRESAALQPAAVDGGGAAIADLLKARDGVYHTMGEVGEWFVLRFPWEGNHDPRTRTAFLRTSGYYRIRIPEGLADRTTELQSMTAEPDGVVRFSYARFREWAAAMADRSGGAEP